MHVGVKNGEMDDMPEVLFRRVFLDPLSDVLDQIPGASAILVPNVRDILSDHAVFPQNALPRAFVDDLVCLIVMLFDYQH
jgi:DNA polymerase alpha subunit B